MTATPTRCTSPAARLIASQSKPASKALRAVLGWGAALTVVTFLAVSLPASVAGILTGVLVSGIVVGLAHQQTK
jgi:hypothetical protein